MILLIHHVLEAANLVVAGKETQHRSYDQNCNYGGGVGYNDDDITQIL